MANEAGLRCTDESHFAVFQISLFDGIGFQSCTMKPTLKNSTFVVKLFLLRFFEVQKTEQRYRERDNELISIQWQFQVKPNFAPKNTSSQFETLSLPQTHQYRVAQPGSPAGVK